MLQSGTESSNRVVITFLKINEAVYSLSTISLNEHIADVATRIDGYSGCTADLSQVSSSPLALKIDRKFFDANASLSMSCGAFL